MKLNVINNGFNVAFAFYSESSEVLQYLNSNSAPVVYSDGDGFIMVKY
jgi:hypothetical protein